MDVYTIFWADLMIMRRRTTRYLVTTLVSPILYLFAFGWGLGRGISVEGANYLDFVIPGIIALTAMNSSFIGAGARLNVDRLFFRSFDEFLMAPISAASLILGKAMIGAFRGLVSSVAFLAVAFLLSPTFSLGPLFVVSLVLTCFSFSFLGGSSGPSGQVPRGHEHLQQPSSSADDLPCRNLLLPIRESGQQRLKEF